MGDKNPIRTLGDYSKPSHGGYRNTIELPVGNNVVPLRSDTIRLVQNGCSFHGLRSEDPNQHLKDFLKLVDSLDLDGDNRERTRLRLFQFSLRDQASNWLERLPAGSITTWEDLTTRFLAQFFPPGRTVKLRNDILMFQQHHGESLSEAWTRFKDILHKVPHHGIGLWLQDLALYDNESWNDPRDFTKSVKAITLPQDVPSTPDCCPIELENQVQRLMEAHLAPTQPTHVNKITTACEICSSPHDTQYCMKIPNKPLSNTHHRVPMKREKALSDSNSGNTTYDTVKNPKLSTSPVLSARSYPIIDPQCSAQIQSSINGITIHPKQQGDSRDDKTEGNEEERKDSLGNIHYNSSTPPDTSVSFITEKVLKFISLFEYLGLVPPSSNTELVCTKEGDGDVMFIKIVPKDDDSRKEEPEAGERVVEQFDMFPTKSEIRISMYLCVVTILQYFLRNPSLQKDVPSNLKIPCNIGHVHVEKAYINLNSPLNIMTRRMYNWIMRRKLDPRETRMEELVIS
ncbi:MAK10-like protein [Tanacetum coccineum]